MWKWQQVKVFQNISNSFATCLIPGPHFPLSQSSSKFHNKIQWKHTAYLKRSLPLLLAILLRFSLLCRILCQCGEEKSIRHVAIVAKFLDDNEPKTWIRTVSNFIDLIQFHLICQMLAKFSGVEFKGPYLSLEKEQENFCVLFTCCVHLLYNAGAWN